MMNKEVLSLCNVFGRWQLGDQRQLRPKWPQNTASPPWGNRPIAALCLCLWRAVSLSISPSDWQAPDAPVCLARALSLFLHCQSDAVFTSWLSGQTAKETESHCDRWSLHTNIGKHTRMQTYGRISTLQWVTFVGNSGGRQCEDKAPSKIKALTNTILNVFKTAIILLSGFCWIHSHPSSLSHPQTIIAQKNLTKGFWKSFFHH